MTDDTRGRREMTKRELEARRISNELVMLPGAEREALLATALAEAERAGMERAAKLIPTNWLDPLLTGPTGIDAGNRGIDRRVIEQLLRGTQDRIRAQAQAGEVG